MVKTGVAKCQFTLDIATKLLRFLKSLPSMTPSVLCRYSLQGMQWCSWLRYCTTSCKVMDLILDWILHFHNPSGHTMVLELTQPLTEMSSRYIFLLGGGVQGSQCVGLTSLPSSCANCLEMWECQPPGTVRTCPGLYRDCFDSSLHLLINCIFVKEIKKIYICLDVLYFNSDSSFASLLII